MTSQIDPQQRGTTPDQQGTNNTTTENRGLGGSTPAVSATPGPSSTGAQSPASNIGEIGYSEIGQIDFDISYEEEGAALPRGGPNITMEALPVGECMIRIMVQWAMSCNLPYPEGKNDSGIGPSRTPCGRQKIKIGGVLFSSSNYRSCSPTTFRALMEAMHYSYERNGRTYDWETHLGAYEYYDMWNLNYSASGPIWEQKGAIDVILELKMGMEINRFDDLKRGDILQTHRVPVVREGGRWKAATDRKKIAGHSSVVYSRTPDEGPVNTLTVISATKGKGHRQIPGAQPGAILLTDWKPDKVKRVRDNPGSEDDPVEILEKVKGKWIKRYEFNRIYIGRITQMVTWANVT